MVLLAAAGVLVAGVLAYFTIGAVATLANWLVLGASFLVGAALVYHLLEGQLTEYFDVLGLTDGSVFQVLTAGVIGAGAGFAAFRILESLLAASTGLIALIIIGAVALFFVNPSLLFSLIQVVIGGVVDAVAGE